MSVIILLLMVGVVYFIIWQFKMLKKYVLSFDRFEVSVRENCVFINKERIDFADIAFVSVREIQQPTATEKMLSKSAYYAYMSELVLHLHDTSAVRCVFNTKGALYKALTQLALYVPVHADIAQYKPRFAGGVLVWVAAVLIAMVLLKACAAG